MLIDKSGLTGTALAGKTVILTGGGGGIGLETARAFVRLGANVIIAEIDAVKGKAAEDQINRELGSSHAEFCQTDLSNEAQVDALVRYAKEKHGFIDVIFNNATITPMGAVDSVPASDWDKSYAVNLRAPLLLAQKLLPDMKQRGSGTIVFVSSSGAAPYMGAYEVFKTAQVELSNTLAAELEGMGVSVFTIGPGLVKTETAMTGIRKIAALMGLSTDEFYRMNEAHMLSAEEAGTGFAIAVVYAEKYNGQEISSIQVLHETGILIEANAPAAKAAVQDGGRLKQLVAEAADTYAQQYDGWMGRNLFERQWVLRDFKKHVEQSAEQFKAALQNIRSLAENGAFDAVTAFRNEFEKLKAYYRHQYDLLQGFEKNPEKLKETSAIILGWVDTLDKILEQLQA